MPSYEYECTNCNYRFEQWQKITEPPLETCPKCNGKVTRLISPNVAFVFKGSGFYITDYKQKELEKEIKEHTKIAEQKRKGVFAPPEE